MCLKAITHAITTTTSSLTESIVSDDQDDNLECNLRKSLIFSNIVGGAVGTAAGSALLSAVTVNPIPIGTAMLFGAGGGAIQGYVEAKKNKIFVWLKRKKRTMQQRTQILHQNNHNLFLLECKKAIYRGRIGVIVLPFIGLICSKCEYISTSKLFLVCVIYLLMCSWENTLSKAVIMIEKISLKAPLNNMGHMRNSIRLAILVQRMFIVMFIILGTFFANDSTIYAKNNIIIFFVGSVIIEFILNPLSKVMKLLEDNMTKL